MIKLIKLVLYGFILLPLLAIAAARDVQVQSVDFDTNIVQITNFGTATQALDGWRFCTHNTTEAFKYSAASGLNGRSLAPGVSLYIHFNNDATQPDEINISTIGGSFATMERGAFAMGFYFSPVIFGNGNTIADHLQWSIDGIDNANAATRSGAAVAGGVWVDASEWIALTSESKHIDLTDLSGSELHSPANYSVTERPADPENIPMLPLPFLAAILALVGVITGVHFKKNKV